MIKLERKGNYAILKLNREKQFNALNSAMMAELNAHLDYMEKDPALKAVIITGTDTAFAAGVDVGELATNPNMIDASWRRLHSFSKPVIAAVAGYAFGGGCELAQMCDIIIAAENAVFAQPEILLGIMPGMGGTKLLTQYVGKSRAMKMCMTGERIDARQALDYGLVTDVLPVHELLKYAETLANNIAAKSLHPIMQIKREINGKSADFESEYAAFRSCFNREDQREGMRAFLEKRPAAVVDR